jgi:hypothetical protein
MTRWWSLSSVLLLSLLTAACVGTRTPSSRVHTLYRSSVVGDERVHVATFDADQSEPYNRDTCEEVRALEEEDVRDRGVALRYWCEKGCYRD